MKSALALIDKEGFCFWQQNKVRNRNIFCIPTQTPHNRVVRIQRINSKQAGHSTKH